MSLQMQTPRNVDLLVTHKCNLRCTYCSHFNSAGDTHTDLPTHEWTRFCEELRSCSVLTVCIAGGEPFLRSDLLEILRSIVRNNLRFTILTNGTLIAEEHIDYLAATPRCDSIQVSLDSAVSRVHDAVRGEGTFRTVITTLRTLVKRDLPVSVRVTIHRGNIDTLPDTIEFLLNDVGVRFLTTNSACFLGLCQINSEHLQLGVSDRTRAMALLATLARQYPGKICGASGPLAEARHWTLMEAQRSAQTCLTDMGGRLSGCAGTFSSIAVRADGVFVPCGQLPSIELGRINEDSLRDVWLKSPILNAFRSRNNIALSSLPFCDGCPYTPYCSGNCPAVALGHTGDWAQPDPDSCLRRFLQAGGELPKTLYEE